MTTSTTLSTTQRGILWGVRILIALVFGAAGAAKLAGVPQMIQIFDAIGFGQWFRYVTGAIEVSGAVLVLISSKSFWGGLLLSATMAGAVFTHLFLIGGGPVPALVLGLLGLFVACALSGAPTPRQRALRGHSA